MLDVGRTGHSTIRNHLRDATTFIVFFALIALVIILDPLRGSIDVRVCESNTELRCNHQQLIATPNELSFTVTNEDRQDIIVQNMTITTINGINRSYTCLTSETLVRSQARQPVSCTDVPLVNDGVNNAKITYTYYQNTQQTNTTTGSFSAHFETYPGPT